MRRWIVAAVCGVLAVSNGRGAEEPVKGTFKAGDERYVAMSVFKEKPGKDGKRGTRSEARMGVAIKVVEAKEDHWLMEFTMKGPRGTRISKEMREMIDRQFGLMGVPVRVRVGHEGEMEIVNLEETRDGALKAAEEAALEGKEDEHAKGNVAKAMKMVEELFADPEKANMLLLSKFQPWFSHLGHDMDDGQPVTEDVELPSPFGDSMLGATRTLTFVKRGEDAREFKVDMKIKDEEAKRMLRELFEKVKGLAPKDKPPPDDAELAKWRYEISGSSRTVFEAASGWPQRVVTSQEVEMKTGDGGGVHKERVECVFEEK
jgi:hypothetical protein